MLRRLIQLYPYQLKFVIAEPGDLLQVNAIVSEIGSLEESGGADGGGSGCGDLWPSAGAG